MITKYESLRKFVITNRLLSRKESFSYSQKGMETFFGNKAFFANTLSSHQNSSNTIDENWLIINSI